MAEQNPPRRATRRNKSSSKSAKARQRNPPKKKSAGWLLLVLIGIGLASLTIGLYLSSDSAEPEAHQFSPEGQVMGPISFEEQTLVEIEIKQEFRTSDGWSQVVTEVYDGKEAFLFSFDKELWAETGHDSDGAWAESETDLTTEILLDPGDYYFLTYMDEGYPPEELGDITFRLMRKRGTFGPMLFLTIVAGVMAFLMVFAARIPPLFAWFVLACFVLVFGFLFYASYTAAWANQYVGGYYSPGIFVNVNYYDSRSVREGSVSGPRRLRDEQNKGK